MRYTIRGIPPHLDLALRERARREGKRLNQVVLEAMARGTPGRSLEDIVGTWSDDPALERALQDQRTP